MAHPRRPDRACVRCGTMFHAHSPRQPHCSRACFLATAREQATTRTHKVCSGCGIDRPLEYFHHSSRRADGRQSQCKACGITARRTTQRDSDLRRKFGITVEQYDRMLADQGGGCAICGLAVSIGRGQFHTDHDRACCPGDKSCGSCVRGILCSLCNTGLGMFKDEPDRLVAAAAYLIRRSNVLAEIR